MGFFINENGIYYEGDRQGGDQDVPQRPSFLHEWNGQAWVSGDKARAAQWEAIKIERDRRIQNGGYQLDGYWFHSDAYSLAQQHGLILAAMQVKASGGDMNAPLIATPWQAMGGVPVVMTASLALRLLSAAIGQQVAIFEAAKTHKEALKVCADPANYDFSGDWPQVFGG